MKTTYLNDQNIKVGFIISSCGRWVDCFKNNDRNIINSFLTFGKNATNSKPNLTTMYSKKEIAIQQRFAVLFRKQKLILNECDNINLSELDLKYFEEHTGKEPLYVPNFLDHLNSLTKNRESTSSIYKKLLNNLN
jgi:hypothetical protein